MQIKISDQWLREYLDTNATPKQIQKHLSLSGPAVESVTKIKNEIVYDLEITTNRVDLASVYGLAREAVPILKQAGFKAVLKPINLAQLDKKITENLLIINDLQKLCPRKLAIVLDQVQVKSSPNWLKNRLEIAGIRSLNNLIDITNYVMLEVGHPVHVFDYDRIKTGKLVIRKARLGEEYISLEHKKYILTNEDIVIDDGTGRIIDLPGIIGAANSIVNDKTKRIVLFIESNQAIKIRRTSMRLGIRTMAASYNENNPDSQLAKIALLRGVRLYQEITNAKPVSQLIDNYSNKPKPKQISLTLDQINQHIGIMIEKAKVIKILGDLGFELQEERGERLTFMVPSYRLSDMMIAEDLIEEIARIYGYDKIPEELPPYAYINDQYIRKEQYEFSLGSEIKRFLIHHGVSEVYNYSMIAKADNEAFGLPRDSIKMLNPMTRELVVFRQSLIPSLFKNVITNRHLSNLKLFELANCYLPKSKSLPQEKKTLGILIQGDYYWLKGLLDGLFHFGHVAQPSFQQNFSAPAYLDQNQKAEVSVQGRRLGYLGKLANSLVYQAGLKHNYSVAELDFSVLSADYSILSLVKPINKKTPIIEDLTYYQSNTTNWQTIIHSIKTEFAAVKQIKLIDRYKNTVTMRLYSHPLGNQSILKEIVSYLEAQLKLKLKKL